MLSIIHHVELGCFLGRDSPLILSEEEKGALKTFKLTAKNPQLGRTANSNPSRRAGATPKQKYPMKNHPWIRTNEMKSPQPHRCSKRFNALFH